MSTATETRVTSATGGQKGTKPQQISTIDPQALLMLAEVSAFGAQKYDAFNYLKGYDWNLSYDAAQRHLMAFWNGEDRDQESGLLHVLHAAWHCLAMSSFIERGLGTDTRYKGLTASDSLLAQLDDYFSAGTFKQRFIMGFDPAAPVEEEPVLAFEEGDRVYVTYGYGWSGFGTVTKALNTSANVKMDLRGVGGFDHLDLIKVEDFSIIGAYVADDEGLDALPIGTVIRITGRVPTVKTRTGWGWVTTLTSPPVDHDTTTRNAVADRGAIVVFDGNVDGPY